MSGSAVEYVEIKLTFERTFQGKSPLVNLVYIAILTHILQARVETHMLARVVTHVLARVVTHVLARVIMHVHDYYLKTCPLVWQKTTFFPDFFPATFPKTTSFPGIILPQVRFGRDRCNFIMSTQTMFSAFCRKNISVAICAFLG